MNRSVNAWTVVALYLEAIFQGTIIGRGTGFVVETAAGPHLVTNWHVITGRHPDTGDPLDSKTGACDPDTLRVWHHVSERLGTWTAWDEPLRHPQTGDPLWREHPLGRDVDVVALPLTHVVPPVHFYPLDLTLANEDIVIAPAATVSIIGFPLGLSAAGRFAIWKTGHVASDLDIDFEGRPVFLVDATTKAGMSGSPVVALRDGSVQRSTGWQLGVTASRFLGIYAGRVRADMDIGRVLKATAILEVLR